MKTGRDDWDAMINATGFPMAEPVFVLRAQNRSAADRVRDWAEGELAAGTSVAVIEQALRQADAMDRWPVKKPITDDHLADHERKQLAYAYRRRIWNRGQVTREALAAALTLDLISSVLDLEDTPGALVDKARELSAVLTEGRDGA